MHWRGILELDKHCPQVQVDQDTSRVDHCRFSTSTGIFTDIERAYSFAEKGHRTQTAQTITTEMVVLHIAPVVSKPVVQKPETPSRLNLTEGIL